MQLHDKRIALSSGILLALGIAVLSLYIKYSESELSANFPKDCPEIQDDNHYDDCWNWYNNPDYYQPRVNIGRIVVIANVFFILTCLFATRLVLYLAFTETKARHVNCDGTYANILYIFGVICALVSIALSIASFAMQISIDSTRWIDDRPLYLITLVISFTIFIIVAIIIISIIIVCITSFIGLICCDNIVKIWCHMRDVEYKSQNESIAYRELV
jgi:hypothetical protein